VWTWQASQFDEALMILQRCPQLAPLSDAKRAEMVPHMKVELVANRMSLVQQGMQCERFLVIMRVRGRTSTAPRTEPDAVADEREKNTHNSWCFRTAGVCISTAWCLCKHSTSPAMRRRAHGAAATRGGSVSGECSGEAEATGWRRSEE